MTQTKGPHFPRDEVDEAFGVYFGTGPVREDWEAWVDLMTDDVHYVDHWWGTMDGKEEVRVWIAASMGGVPEIYTVLDWYTIEDATVVFHMQNRRDNPDPDGPPYFDFAGLSVATYAGDGKWAGEEDFWDLSGARRTATAYAQACEKAGVTDAADRITRKYWPESPSWARYDGVPTPSWLAGSIPGVTRPSQLAALLAPLRADKEAERTTPEAMEVLDVTDTRTMEPPTPDLYYDPYDYDVDVNAQAIWKRLRDEAPLYRNDEYDFYALSRYDDVLPVMLDTETFTSTHATTIELMGPEPAQMPMMIWMDPPNHTRFRQLVNRAFTPRAISDLDARISRLCAQLLDPHLGAGSFDYVDQFAALLPPTVILALLGFPEGHESEWRTGVDALFHVEEGGTGFEVGEDGLPKGIADPNGAMNAALFHLLPDIMADRRAHPNDDLMSMLVNSEFEAPDGSHRKIDEVEFNGFIQMLAIAGTETVARLLSWAAVLLARNPDQRAALVADPALLANGVEELLRYEAPSPVNARWVTRDVEFHGERVPAGSKLVMLNGSGNRDERHFPDPDRFDVRRQIDRHLSFGYGAHFCIGAALARLETRIALRETLARIPTWEIDEDRIEWVHTSTVRGFAKVPISF